GLHAFQVRHLTSSLRFDRATEKCFDICAGSPPLPCFLFGFPPLLLMDHTLDVSANESIAVKTDKAWLLHKYLGRHVCLVVAIDELNRNLSLLRRPLSTKWRLEVLLQVLRSQQGIFSVAFDRFHADINHLG